MPNRFNNIYDNNYVSNYVPLPLEFIAQQGAMKQKKQDEAQAERMDLLGKQWNRLGADNEKAKQAKLEVNQVLDSFATQDFNDPSVKSSWYQKKRELADRFGPQGDIGAMESNFKAHQNYISKLDEALKKGPKEGGIDETTYNKLANISLLKYQGIGENGSMGYNQYSGIIPAGYSDIPKQADELAKGWKENKKKTEGWNETSDGKLYKKNGNTTEWIDDQEIYNNILPQLMENPMNQAFAKQQVLLDSYDKPVSKEEQDKAYLNYFDSPAKFVSNKYGYKQTAQEEDIQQSQEYLQKQKDKLDKPQFTLFNESVIVPGEKTDFNSLSKNVETINQQLAGLPIEGSANDNYETQAVRKDLNKKLTIASNYLNTGRTRFYESEEGRKALDVVYSKLTTPGFKEFNIKELLPYLENKSKFVEYIKNNPSELKNTMEQLTGLQNNVSDYIDKNPISYSAKVLTGNEHSTVGKVNTELTERVNKNGTNYYTVDGADLNVWKTKNLAEGDKMEVAVMDDDLDGNFAHYMTIKDKNGVIKSEMPIYPKNGGREEQGYIGRKLIEENQAKQDPLETSNYNRGAKMLANSLYGDQIDESLLKSYVSRLENNSSKSINVPVSLNINGGKFDGKIKMHKSGNIVSYELVNLKGESLMKNDKPVNSIDDLKVSLLGL